MTNEERIHKTKAKKVGVIYNILGRVLKPVMYKKYNVSVVDKVGMKKVKEQHIFISNHTSRIDYFFNGFHQLPNRYNFVAGYNEFYRKQFKFIFKLVGIIPKKNFYPDTFTIKQMTKVIRQGGNVAIFPEGMNSISGANQPVAIGTGKMIKHFKLPVYYSVIHGGYLTVPKYAQEERSGKVEVVYDKMFTPEEIEKLTPEQIEDIINEKLYHDDYAWNKEHGYTYKTNGHIADNLHHLLFRCPRCGQEFTMIGLGDQIKCTSCGNGARIDDAYNMIPYDDKCVIPETQTKWFNWEREQIKKEVQDKNYSFSDHVKLGMLPEDYMIEGDATSIIVGEGTLTIDRTGLTYDGTKDGEQFKFHIDSLTLPTYGMCTDVSRFYTFLDGKFVEFYPTVPCVEKFVISTEEIHRLNGGKWQDFKFEK